MKYMVFVSLSLVGRHADFQPSRSKADWLPEEVDMPSSKVRTASDLMWNGPRVHVSWRWLHTVRLVSYSHFVHTEKHSHQRLKRIHIRLSVAVRFHTNQDLQYTGAGMDTERVALAYTWQSVYASS